MEILKEYQLVLMFLVFISLAYAAKLYFNAMSLKHAEDIVKRQFEAADPKIIEAGFKFYSGKQLERYTTLLIRMRRQYGHDGLKVGHQALLIAVVSDKNQDVNTVVIPSFTEKN
jgi:hypothetical protein